MSDERKPVLWLSLTSTGRGHGSQEAIQEVAESVEAAVGDDYEVVVADDRVRLLDDDEVRSLVHDLAERVTRMEQESSLFQATTESDGGEDA